MSRDVGVGQLVEDLEARGDRLPFEIGAFVALEACEGLLHESVRLEADDVRVTLDGAVVVAASAERAEPDEAARSLASVLGRLLVAAGPGVPPHLLQLVKDSATGQNPRDLRHLHDAIEASLIPINRGASRRVLARLVRESDRPPAPEEAPGLDPEALDAELDELLRDPSVRTLGASPIDPSLQDADVEEPITERIRMPRPAAKEVDLELQPETVKVPPSEPARRRSSVSIPDLRPPPAATSGGTAPERRPIYQRPQDPVTATIRKWQPIDEPLTPPATGESISESVYVSVSESVRARAPSNGLETASESVFGTGAAGTGAATAPPPRPDSESRPPSRASQPPPAPLDDRPSATPPQPSPRRRGGWGIWLLAAALGLGAYALIASGALDSAFKPSAPAPSTAEPGVIELAVTPDDAQVFVFIGRGPAAAPGLRVGEAHEFVVLDRGLRPTRASVPEGAAWPSATGTPLYELAIQAQPDAAGAEASLGLPETSVTADRSAGDGTVRVVTNPPGAKVYRFMGTGPAVEIQVASIHEGQEILIHHPAHETERQVVGPSDWETTLEGARQAKVTAELQAVPASAAPDALED